MGDAVTCDLPCLFGVCHGKGQCCSLLSRVTAPLRSYSLSIVTHPSLPLILPTPEHHQPSLPYLSQGIFDIISSHPQDMICVSDPNQNKLAV